MSAVVSAVEGEGGDGITKFAQGGKLPGADPEHVFIVKKEFSPMITILKQNVNLQV